AEHELIAVRRSFGYAGCSGHAAGAADVLDDNGAPKTVGKPRTEDTAEDVERAPGRERDDHGDRPCRPVLRGGTVCDAERAAQKGRDCHGPSHRALLRTRTGCPEVQCQILAGSATAGNDAPGPQAAPARRLAKNSCLPRLIEISQVGWRLVLAARHQHA